MLSVNITFVIHNSITTTWTCTAKIEQHLVKIKKTVKSSIQMNKFPLITQNLLSQSVKLFTQKQKWWQTVLIRAAWLVCTDNYRLQ